MAETALAIVNGTSDPPIPLSTSQILSIGALEGADGELKCTGFMLDDRWVATAGHCASVGSFDGLMFRTGLGDEGVRVPITGYFWHPQVDVLLLELPPSSGLASLGISFLPFGLPPPDASAMRQAVTLVGYGTTESGESGRRRFVSEPIVQLDETFVTVDGDGVRGACNSDSGGPLLAVESNGGISVIGLLSEGSVSCRGRDRYLRISTFESWLDELKRKRKTNPCGNLTWEGTCHEGQLPSWCAGDHVETQVCGPDELCGWSDAQQGFRCIDEALDPCRGVGPSGSCEGEVLVRCARGKLSRIDCGACEQTCLAESTGTAQCSL